MVSELNKIKSKSRKVLKKYNVVRAGIFGSYVRGEQKRNSDVDIVIQLKDKKMSLLGFIKIKNELEKELGKKVDLVEYHVIKPRIKKFILNEEVRII